jgi:hypothetical protein
VTIMKGGTATYHRPSPSSASPRMFTRFICKPLYANLHERRV